MQKWSILKCQKSIYSKAELPALWDVFPKFTGYFMSYNTVKSLSQTHQIMEKKSDYTHTILSGKKKAAQLPLHFPRVLSPSELMASRTIWRSWFLYGAGIHVFPSGKIWLDKDNLEFPPTEKQESTRFLGKGFVSNTVTTPWPVPAVNRVGTSQRIQQSQLINNGNHYYSAENSPKLILLT